MRMLAKYGDPDIRSKAQTVVESTPADETLDDWWKNWWSNKWKEGIGWLAEQLGRKAHRLEYTGLSAFVHSSPALADFYFREAKNGAGVILESRPGVSDENRDWADTVTFSIFQAFVNVCGAFAQQMRFDFGEELTQINQLIEKQFIS